MAKAKISDADYKRAHTEFMAALSGPVDAMGQGAAFKRFKRDGLIARRVSARQYEKFLAAGGKAGDWQSFLTWLKENLPTIIAMILALF